MLWRGVLMPLFIYFCKQIIALHYWTLIICLGCVCSIRIWIQVRIGPQQI